MSEPTISTAEILVHLVRPGVGTDDYQLTEGATLADLLDFLGLSGASTMNQVVRVNGSRLKKRSRCGTGSS